jgi:hypothetical protein
LDTALRRRQSKERLAQFVPGENANRAKPRNLTYFTFAPRARQAQRKRWFTHKLSASAQRPESGTFWAEIARD